MREKWRGDFMRGHAQKLENEPLKGKGKKIPEHVLQGDVLDRTIQHSGFKPVWVKLQRQIHQAIKDALKSNDVSPQRIVEINEMIRDYNRKCPPPMQRGLVSKDTLKTKLQLWE
ncbi:hypothetical protein [Alteribacillus sp. HJP-4]|uniref:hypothetical protein n=1 Tax=Alteribacillus sp. HJP-4 TaxID=2775394 RepID=UPI0035CCD14F